MCSAYISDPCIKYPDDKRYDTIQHSWWDSNLGRGKRQQAISDNTLDHLAIRADPFNISEKNHLPVHVAYKQISTS